MTITCFDFSGHTFQSLLLGDTCQHLHGLVDLFVHLDSVLSDVVVSGPGAPQGTILSPSLSPLTHHRPSVLSEPPQVCPDDSAIVGCLSGGGKGDYAALVESAGGNNLRVDVDNTRGGGQRQEEGEEFTTTVHSGRGGGGLQIPGCQHQQEQEVPQEAELIQHVQQDVGDVLPGHTGPQELCVMDKVLFTSPN